MGVHDKYVAWIMVEVHFSGLLPEILDLAWGLLKIRQRLDYWKSPLDAYSVIIPAI